MIWDFTNIIHKCNGKKRCHYAFIYVLIIWDVTNIIHECNGKNVVIIQSGNYGLLATGENEDIVFAVDTTKQICNNL